MGHHSSHGGLTDTRLQSALWGPLSSLVSAAVSLGPAAGPESSHIHMVSPGPAPCPTHHRPLIFFPALGVISSLSF